MPLTPSQQVADRALRQATAMKAAHPDARLEDFSQDEQNVLEYELLCALRCKAYKARAAEITLPPVVRTLIDNLSSRYPHGARAWANDVSWKVAFLIARYGEEPRHWPEAFSASDEARATEWLLKGKWPQGILPAPA